MTQAPFPIRKVGSTALTLQLLGDSLHLVIGLPVLSNPMKVSLVKSILGTENSKNGVKTETSTFFSWVKGRLSLKNGVGKSGVPNISEALRQQRKNDRTASHNEKAGDSESDDIFGAVMDAFNDDSIKPYAVIEPDPIEVPADPKPAPSDFVLFKRKPARSKA